MFTTSKCPGAPVEWCREALKGGTARALVVNSGNANAFTGLKGREAVALTARIAAKAVGCKPGEVFISSTGVIGEPLDAAAVDAAIKPDDWNAYRIRAEGPRIRSWINGVPAIDFTETDASIPLDGLIGIQIHSGGVAAIEVREVILTELEPSTSRASK